MGPRIRHAIRAAILAACLFAAPAKALEVHDSANLVQNARQVAEAIKQLQEAIKIAQNTLATLEAIGGAGPLTGLGPSPWQLSTAAQLRNISPVFTSWRLPSGIQPNFTSVRNAEQFVRDVLLPPSPTSNGPAPVITEQDQNTLLYNRLAAQRDAATAAIAAAYSARQTVDSVTAQATSIVQKTAAAQDLRGQLGVTNQALSDILTELALQRTLMAAMVEVLGTQSLREIPLAYGMHGVGLQR